MEAKELPRIEWRQIRRGKSSSLDTRNMNAPSNHPYLAFAMPHSVGWLFLSNLQSAVLSISSVSIMTSSKRELLNLWVISPIIWIGAISGCCLCNCLQSSLEYGGT
eukprot:scaffold133814_cov21-Tisochrysis_lutea.AAC.4